MAKESTGQGLGSAGTKWFSLADDGEGYVMAVGAVGAGSVTTEGTTTSFGSRDTTVEGAGTSETLVCERQEKGTVGTSSLKGEVGGGDGKGVFSVQTESRLSVCVSGTNSGEALRDSDPNESRGKEDSLPSSERCSTSVAVEHREERVGAGENSQAIVSGFETAPLSEIKNSERVRMENFNAIE